MFSSVVLFWVKNMLPHAHVRGCSPGCPHPRAGRLGTDSHPDSVLSSLVAARKFVCRCLCMCGCGCLLLPCCFLLPFIWVTFPAPGLVLCISSCRCLSRSSLQERGADILDWSEEAHGPGSLPILCPVEWALQKSFLHVLCGFQPLVLFLMPQGPAVSS